jgi:hypothetical protein
MMTPSAFWKVPPLSHPFADERCEFRAVNCSSVNYAFVTRPKSSGRANAGDASRCRAAEN